MNPTYNIITIKQVESPFAKKGGDPPKPKHTKSRSVSPQQQQQPQTNGERVPIYLRAE